jgi:hypothetical protein
VLRHKRLKSTTQEEDLKVVEYLGGKAVGENTVADRIMEDSVELCQVGIERVYSGAQRKKNSAES